MRDANQFSIVGSRGSKYNPSQEPRTPSSSYFDFHLWTIYQFLLCSVIIGYAGTTLLIVTFHSHSEHHFQHYLSITLSNHLFLFSPSLFTTIVITVTLVIKTPIPYTLLITLNSSSLSSQVSQNQNWDLCKQRTECIDLCHSSRSQGRERLSANLPFPAPRPPPALQKALHIHRELVERYFPADRCHRTKGPNPPNETMKQATKPIAGPLGLQCPLGPNLGNWTNCNSLPDHQGQTLKPVLLLAFCMMNIVL